MSSADALAPDVATIGEALGVLTPVEQGRMRDVMSYEKDVGGAELNVAVAFARLGHTARWLGAVGDDEIGHEALAVLRGAGVDVANARLVPGGRTGMYLKERRATGRVQAHYYRDGSPAAGLAPGDVDIEAITDARVVHLTGITAFLEPTGADVVRAVLESATARGRTVTFDVNFRHRLLRGRDARSLVGPALAAAHVVVFSEEEAAGLLGGSDVATLAAALDDLPAARLLVVHGFWGAVGVEAGHVWRTGSCQTPAVVDTVGAGDAFMAGLLSGILRDWPTERALRLANACGSCAVGIRGDARSMPYADDALRLVDGLGLVAKGCSGVCG